MQAEKDLLKELYYAKLRGEQNMSLEHYWEERGIQRDEAIRILQRLHDMKLIEPATQGWQGKMRITRQGISAIERNIL